MLDVYREELKDKHKLARKGKGSRINRRFMALPRSEFSRHNYSDVVMGLPEDHRTHPLVIYDSKTKCYHWIKRQTFRNLDPNDPLAQPLTTKQRVNKFDKYKLKI